MRSVAQLLLMCDRQDLGLSVDTGAPDVPRGRARAPLVAGVDPHVFIYDNYPGGIGFSAPLFRMEPQLLRATYELIAGCECDAGCPSCVGPIGDIGPLAKRVAIELLESIDAASGASASSPSSDSSSRSSSADVA
jgi:DEAD/DEAH box helicase domain-containing protein